jgi:predicted phosphohydrolase
VGSAGAATPLTAILDDYRIDLCVFGHRHGLAAPPRGADCRVNRTRYVLTSCDCIGFRPILLLDPAAVADA